MDIRSIGFIGAGNMTRSIIGGLVNGNYPNDKIFASNPSQPKLDALVSDFGINVTNDNLELVKQVDVIVLAVKPQLMQQMCEKLQGVDLSNKLFITIAAGIKAERYHDYLGQSINLVRTMPNTPSLLGKGLTGLYAPQLNECDRNYCNDLMAAVGQTVWVENEFGLDQVIACAGSSPAYFFLFAEAMIASAKKMGTDEQQARTMVASAMAGAAAMLEQNPDISAAQLRANVTSKGGTTAAAIEQFEQADLRTIVDDAMTACVARADAMAKIF
ncbi:pyrroline-5-carboxylate reductase [Paraferrimonas sp. SM1919]|uniref:pyrroline-5-carboxylate reductase n=1 Tax=Paraferrimonas sp. SM1919 TaxID=2662263 RepID=UPI0013D4D3B8|nr:pyrroline-5-carboxylate reductase [Paraferrimonas sp. SM1919]